VFFPAIAMAGTREPQRTVALFDRLLRVTFGGLLLPTMLLVLLSRDILRIWLGAAFVAQSAGVLQVLAIAIFANVLGQAALTFVQGLGRPDITGKYHVLELPFYALALWILLPRYGILGAALAWAARALTDALALLLTCPALLRETRMTVYRTLVWLTIALGVLAGCIVLSASPLRFVAAAIAIPSWLAISWRWMMTPHERTAPARALSAVWRPERA
jgi:O-antigen/teichoic acid export membrane protein